jgi:hypothetical protein
MALPLIWLPTFGGSQPAQASPTGSLSPLWLTLFGSGSGSGSAPATTQPFDFDLRAYLAAKLGQPVYPVHIPQQVDPSVEVLPCYTYTLVSSEHLNKLASPLGICDSHYQVDVWAYLYDDAVTMSESVRLALQGYVGLMGTTTVQSCLLHNEITQDESPPNASDKWVYHRIKEFRIFYRESIPTFP